MSRCPDYAELWDVIDSTSRRAQPRRRRRTIKGTNNEKAPTPSGIVGDTYSLTHSPLGLPLVFLNCDFIYCSDRSCIGPLRLKISTTTGHNMYMYISQTEFTEQVRGSYEKGMEIGEHAQLAWRGNV